MKTLLVKFSTRRELCEIVGRRAALLTPDQAAEAWFFLSGHLDGMGDPGNHKVPKFLDVMAAIRAATIFGVRSGRAREVKRGTVRPRPIEQTQEVGT